MSNLEDLVPPLKLCLKIPFPKFEDSVFVWDRKNSWIMERTYMDCDLEEEGYYVPAPTLQEILADMAKGNETLESHSPELNYNDFCGGWIVRGRTLNIQRSGIFPDWIDVRDKNNPATAALKLWLEVNKTYESNKTYETDEEK